MGIQQISIYTKTMNKRDEKRRAFVAIQKGIYEKH